MSKTWFAYEYGFVNIDEENLYLTNSGNWSETKELQEKSTQGVNQNKVRSWSTIIFLTGCICLLTYVFIDKLMTSKGIMLSIGIPIAGYKLYDYLRSSIGSKFMIPLSKIKEFTIEGSHVKILFLNENNIIMSELLTNVEPKGLDFLEKYRLKYNTL